MDGILIRAADALPRQAQPVPKQPLRELLAAVAQSLAERVTLPHRDLPPEWFRFPLP